MCRTTDTVLLLFRPSPACPRPSQEALATCLSSSSYIIRIFKSLQRKNKINWYWLSVSGGRDSVYNVVTC